MSTSESTTNRASPIEIEAHAGERAFVASVLRAEAEAVASLADRVGEQTVCAIDLIDRTTSTGGCVIVVGLGKSGLIGQKISATLASLGVTSHAMHPSDAMHGDLGRIRPVDCVLAISFSGETEEVVTLVQVLRTDNIPVISITGGEGGSSLARVSSVQLTLGQIMESGDLGLAPTSSTTATLALGDALALAVARRRAFGEDDFAKRHPGGTLGGLLRPVMDVARFRVGDGLPLIREEETVRQALEHAQSLERRPGALLIVDRAGALSGIFTDGDLRRLVLHDAARLNDRIDSVMTRSPRVLPTDALVRDAERMVREFRQDEIPIVDALGKPVALIDVQDLMALKVVQS
ncbi:MAG: KpsF/GutQ family sugar-phosphate isomerase [Planctomycetota bacterium]